MIFPIITLNLVVGTRSKLCEVVSRQCKMWDAGFAWPGNHMTPDEREQMNSLSLRIQEEKDYATFAALLRELNQLVGRKERRFNRDTVVCDSQHTRP